jgi:mannosyltransferase
MMRSSISGVGETTAADSPSPVSAGDIARHRARAILTFLTIIGATLRLWHLGAQSLWLDEGATVALARAPWQHFAWVWWHGEASLQTVYFVLMRAWVHGGLSEAWLRLPSALFGIASIPLLYVVARRIVGVYAALAAAALLTFSPAHIYFSQEARAYSLGILLVLVSTLFFVKAIESDRRSDWALWTIFGIAAFYTHYFAALVLLAQAASLLFRREPTPWRSVIICSSIIFLAAIPGLTYPLRASPENLHFAWMPRADPKEIWDLLMFFGGSGVKVGLSLVLWGAGVVAILRDRQKAESRSFWRGMLILLWAMLPALLLGLISLREPLFLQRYMVFSLPAAILLAAVGAAILRECRLGAVLVVALCALSLPSMVKQFAKARDDWRGASQAVLASATPGDAVVFFPFYTRVMLDYYESRYGGATPSLHVFAPEYYAGGEDDRNLLATLNRDPQQFRHVWVFVAGDDANLQSFERGPELEQKLRAVYGRPAVQQFADVNVLRFGR